MDSEQSLDLTELKFFSTLPVETLEQLAPFTSVRSYAPGEVIFREGEEGKEVFVVRSGRAAVEICAPGMGCRRLLVAGPGELLGWSPLLGPARPLTATARATEPLEVLAVDAARLRQLFEEQPAIGYQLMQEVARALAKRLAATRMQLLDLYGDLPPHTPSIPEEGDG